MSNWKTFDQCYEDRLKMLHGFKKTLKIINKNNGHNEKKFNYEQFKQNVKDRKFDCIAGMFFNKDTKLYHR